MEPIKINIEVALSQPTLAVLEKLIGAPAVKTPTAASEEAPEEAPKETKKEKEAQTAPQPDPQPAPVAEDDDDLPPGNETPAPAPKPVPTEADARQAVKAAKDRGVNAKAIRSYMQKTFGIASSVDCPEERRQELIDGLNALAA